MPQTWTHLIGMSLIVLGTILLVYTVAHFASRLILGLMGYKMLDVGLYLCGYPPLAYWISWIRARWGI